MKYNMNVKCKECQQPVEEGMGLYCMVCFWSMR